MHRFAGMLKSLPARWRGFCRGESGMASVEAVIWMPVFILLIAVVADTSAIFGRQAEALRVVQDANRSLSLGRFLTIEETETYIQSNIASISPNATVDTVIVAGIITTTVVLPISDIGITGLVDAFDQLSVTISADFMSEV
ncbi:MAG: TadE/TadG family type IV pilus assembly protein [Paracoccaceae bacterium]